jgi:hypothetical protein
MHCGAHGDGVDAVRSTLVHCKKTVLGANPRRVLCTRDNRVYDPE